ncbi:hypothetical protein V6N13_053566 [Hibiscus sabdariffa]
MHSDYLYANLVSKPPPSQTIDQGLPDPTLLQGFPLGVIPYTKPPRKKSTPPVSPRPRPLQLTGRPNADYHSQIPSIQFGPPPAPLRSSNVSDGALEKSLYPHELRRLLKLGLHTASLPLDPHPPWMPFARNHNDDLLYSYDEG